jgi:hypothetical protein
LLAGADVWGERLLARPGGPSYARVRALLPPLLYAAAPGDRRVTESGVYYLALTPPPTSPYEQRGFALHVADGSEIITRRIGGRSLTILVGAGGTERYGSCLARLAPAQLAAGYLPILQTSYVDAGGARYRQESFVGRLPGTHVLASFVRLSVDTRAVGGAALVRLRPSVAGLRGTGATLGTASGTLLLASRGGSFDGHAIRYVVPQGREITIYAVWLGDADRTDGYHAGAGLYDAVRKTVAKRWAELIAQRTRFDVPDRRIMDAERALLGQELAMTWRYSVGNTYEELSIAEALDVAEVMAEYGDDALAKEILRFTLRKLPRRFSNWRAGERLAAGAVYFWLARDRRYISEETPALAAAVSRLAAQIDRRGSSGLVDRQAISSDVGTKAYGLHAETAVWQGLSAMGEVWARTGHPQLAGRCRMLAARLGHALREAVDASERPLPDGSLFVPVALLDPGKPFRHVTESRAGTYWNLLTPYALASGFFPPQNIDARRILLYLLRHGSRLLGLVRGGDYKLYDGAGYPASGTDQVYGLNVSRFLADDDEPDQLVLSLYGMLGAAMTPNTFVAGEGASVAPLAGRVDRTMLLPPNSAANAAFLETLRLMLVHETRNAEGTSTGLQLAFATPRNWLDPGRTVSVDNAPTGYGPVSYAIHSLPGHIRVRVDAPPRAKSLWLRLRLPAGARLRSAESQGRSLDFDPANGTIDLSGFHGRFTLTATTSRH